MGAHFRVEEDIHLTLFVDHVRHAKCADPAKCAFANLGRDELTAEVYVAIEESTGQVRITWRAPDPGKPEQSRFHRGYLTPQGTAIRILMLTDQSKATLVRQMPPEGLKLVITDHRSRKSQARTTEEKLHEAEKRADLARRRAAGLAPPPKPRPNTPPKSTSMGLRGVARPPARSIPR